MANPLRQEDDDYNNGKLLAGEEEEGYEIGEDYYFNNTGGGGEEEGYDTLQAILQEIEDMKAVVEEKTAQYQKERNELKTELLALEHRVMILKHTDPPNELHMAENYKDTD